MGKDTASNQGRAIATRGTKHYAVAEPKDGDVCHPDKRPDLAANYENHIKTGSFLEVATNSQITRINGFRIWIDGGRVGEIGGWQSNPPHAPAIVALKTGQHYRREAWNMSCSDDLLVEGLGVVRTDDDTKQNFCNCDGKVDGSQLDAAAREATDLYFKNSCRVEVVYGKSGNGKMGKRAPASSEWNFLDVYAGDSVDLWVARHTVRAGVHAPAGACQLVPAHTIWKFKRTGGDIPPKEEKKNGDKVTIGASLTNAQKWEANIPALKTDAKHDSLMKGIMPGGGDDRTGAEIDFANLVTMWRLEKHPAYIAVTAESCGATKNALLRLKPKGKVFYQLTYGGEAAIKKSKTDPPSFAKAFRTIRKTKDAVNVFSRIASVSGVTINFGLLEGFTARVQLEYKRCLKDGITPISKQAYTTAHIRPAWHIAIGCEPLVYLEISGKILLLSLIGAWCPPLMVAASKLARLFKFGVFVEVGVKIHLNVSFSVGQDQHEEFIGETGRYVGMVITLFIKLSLELSQAAEAWVEASVTAEPKLFTGVSDKPGTLLKLRFEGKIGTKVQIGGRLWIFEATKDTDGPGWSPPPAFTYFPAVGN